MARASPRETFYAEVMSCDDHIGLDQHARVMVTIGYGKWVCQRK